MLFCEGNLFTLVIPATQSFLFFIYSFISSSSFLLQCLSSLVRRTDLFGLNCGGICGVKFCSLSSLSVLSLNILSKSVSEEVSARKPSFVCNNLVIYICHF